jgi:hypothetical protein
MFLKKVKHFFIKSKSFVDKILSSLEWEFFCVILLIISAGLSITTFLRFTKANHYEFFLNNETVLLVNEKVNVSLLDITKCTNFFSKKVVLLNFSYLFYSEDFNAKIYNVLSIMFFWLSLVCNSIIQFEAIYNKIRDIEKKLPSKMADWFVKLYFVPSAFLYSMIDYNDNCVNIKRYPDIIVILAIASSIILLSSLAVTLPFNYFLLTTIEQWNKNSRPKSWFIKRTVYTVILGVLSIPFLCLCIAFYLISLIGPVILFCVALLNIITSLRILNDLVNFLHGICFCCKT